MKKYIYYIFIVFISIFASVASAQMMGGGVGQSTSLITDKSPSDIKQWGMMKGEGIDTSSTEKMPQKENQQGGYLLPPTYIKDLDMEPNAIIAALESRQIKCSDISRSNFESLGRYYVFQKFDASLNLFYEHLAFILGDNGSKQYFMSLGLRKSGCGMTGKNTLPSYIENSMKGDSTGDAASRRPPQNKSIQSKNLGGMLYYGFNNNYEYPYNSCGLRPFGIIAFICLAIILGYIIYKSYVKSWKCCNSDNSIRIIRERYARGEIDRYEFEEKKNLLE